MVRPFPTEILERIIFYYFKRDRLLHTPEDDFTLDTPSRGSTSLLLISKGFRLLVLPSLFYSVSVTEQRHWELLFRSGSRSGLMDGEGQEARTRRSWVRELKIDLDVALPIALDPNGSLSSKSASETLNTPSNGIEDHLIHLTPAHPTLFPNLVRLTLLHSPTTSLPRFLRTPPRDPWSPDLILRIGQDGDSSSHTLATSSLQMFKKHILRGLHASSSRAQEEFLSGLGPREVSLSMMDFSSLRWIGGSSLWTQEAVVKSVVCASPPPADTTILPSPFYNPTTFFSPSQDTYSTAFVVDEFRWSAAEMKRVRFIDVPFPLRRRLWAKLNRMAAEGSNYEYDADDEEEFVEEGDSVDWLLEALKKEWVWVEEGREVEFEEGMRLKEGGQDEE